MCNLYRLDVTAAQIADAFDADANGDQWQGDYVAPMRAAPIIRHGAKQQGARWQRFMQGMVWGIAPPSTGKLAGAAHITNVRNLESPFWIGSLKAAPLRCLIPATSFQEWSSRPDPRSGRKTAHWYSVPSQPVFALAGIWRDNGEMPFFAMLTTDANVLVSEVHPKAMPVILHREDYDTWLTGDWKDAKELVASFPSQLMKVDLQPPGAEAGRLL